MTIALFVLVLKFVYKKICRVVDWFLMAAFRWWQMTRLNSSVFYQYMSEDLSPQYYAFELVWHSIAEEGSWWVERLAQRGFFSLLLVDDDFSVFLWVYRTYIITYRVLNCPVMSCSLWTSRCHIKYTTSINTKEITSI